MSLRARVSRHARAETASLVSRLGSVATVARLSRATCEALGRDGLRLALFGAALLDRELALDRVDFDRIARLELALEQHLRERVRDLVLDLARERARAEVRVVADGGDVVLGLVADDERDLLRRELLAHADELEVDDLPDLFLVEGLEDDGRVDPVEELGAEEALHLFLDPFLHPLIRGGDIGIVAAFDFAAEPERGLALQHLLREVARHDDDRVAEVDTAPLRVRQAALIEDLQQHVEDLGVGLLDLVEQDHAIRLAPHRLRYLA